METFRDVLLGIRRLMPFALIDGVGWEKLLQRTTCLPCGAAPVFGFEFDLGDPTPAADFFVRVRLSFPLVQYYIRRAQNAPPDSADAAFARYLSELDTPRFGSDTLINMVIFEYDIIKGPSDPNALPGVFIKFNARAPVTTNASRSEIAASVAESCGWEKDARESHVVEQLCKALPQRARIGFSGALPNRDSRAVRLIISGIPMPEIPAYLRRVGWPGNVERVEALIRDLHPMIPHSAVAIDAGMDGPSPRLGLEMRVLATSQLLTWMHSSAEDWKPVLAHLEKREWCLADKGPALEQSLGFHSLWGTDGVYNIYHGLNHIKMLINQDQISAKAYTGMFLAPSV